MKGIYLLLGSNMGDRQKTLEEAKNYISKSAGNVLRESQLYETAAWGIEDQPDFINQVLEIESNLSPEFLLDELLNIEKEMGRVREVKWGQRLIDIDVLYYGRKIVQTHRLKIPHPEIPNRRFTLVPLCELSPDFVNPKMSKTNRILLKECTDDLEVTLFTK
jgi:2-amino-4-hydroxy-6-hydroxymethyldihydropteridine diphosphokinase